MRGECDRESVCVWERERERERKTERERDEKNGKDWLNLGERRKTQIR